MPRPDRAPRHARQWFRPAAAGVLCTLLAVGGCTQAPEPRPGNPGPPDTSRVAPFDGLTDRPAPGPGTNYLLVGLDRRTGMSKQEKQRLHVGGEGCNCTDVMMLLHVSEDRRRVGVISIPRDSYVEFAPHPEAGAPARTLVRHRGKINAAYKHGGPALAVATVERATGLRIDHYLQADFTGFVDAVDRLGGGTVCTDKALRDPGSGLDLPPGTHHVDGRGALQYVRARKLDPPGDLGRVRRQQRFLVGVAQSLFAGRPAGGDRSVSARAARDLLTTLRTDKGLTTDGFSELARALRRLPTRAAEFATVPISEFDHRVPEWGSTLVWDRNRAAALFRAVREDRSIIPERRPGERPKVPVAMAPASVRVRVAEGPGAEPGSAGRLARQLRKNGFTVLGGRPAAPPSATPAAVKSATEIRYDPKWHRYLSTLASALPDARPVPEKGHGRVFEITTGAVSGRYAEVVHDRSSVEGAPVTGKELSCD
ncbi:LCP family protein [Streptomyces sp. Ru87]|uniref:LCP family protein n=1 Tax=Streptomyces sp. Ru87 TaxID=2044307 RepID=UPI000BFA4187|nr:LCP family protein [Streptomyces sp. Ru87]PGH49723.1 hypothetical protein CRI70_16385 [Streptomyces sp. Ru87]